MPSNKRDAGREHPPRIRRSHRTVAQALQPDRAQDRDRDHRQVAHASGVVEVHVAERHLEEQRLEPTGRDDHVQHEEPREHHASAERHDERSTRAIAPREQHGEQHDRADVRAGGGAERERPGRPHAVRREWTIGDVRRRSHRLPERVVAAVQARRADERQSRDQDGEARERHGDQEQAGASGGGPSGDLAAADGRHRRRDQERRQQQRAHHQTVAHVGARHLRPRERRQGEPRQAARPSDRHADTPRRPPARSWSSRGSPRTAARSPCPRSTSASRGTARPPSRPGGRATPCAGTRRDRARRAAG